jgi:glucokinase
VLLVVDHEEDVDTHVPMVSRILHLLVIDILAVGLAMRRTGQVDPNAGGASLAANSEPAVSAGRRVAPGVSASLPLARLTSHSR